MPTEGRASEESPAGAKVLSLDGAGTMKYAVASRAFDLIVSTLLIILLSPILLIVAGLIKMHDGGPVLYKARRSGRGGAPIDVYKFRTMVPRADRHGPAITKQGDSRITPVGRFLRRTKLDELPQLFNVIQGSMSIVGPRPEDPRYVAHYSPVQRRILDVRPGITSLASIRYRNEQEDLVSDDWEAVYIHEILPEKIAVDLEYIQKRSLGMDLKIILKTIGALFR